MNNKLTLTALAIAAIGIGLATSAPARASGNLLDKCQNYGSRHATEKCCSSFIRLQGRPWWFGDTGTCHNVVACAKQANNLSATLSVVKPKCHIVMPMASGDGGSRESKSPQPRDEGKGNLARGQ